MALTRKRPAARKRKRPARLAPLPKSKATNAYDLLSDVRKAILNEPLRYNQASWLTVAPSAAAARRNDMPTCGTVGCVAGWVVALTSDRARLAKLAASDNVGDVAARILGIPIPTGGVVAAFGSRYWDLFRHNATGDAPPGTWAHAEAGAAHIARFQAAYRTQLKRKRI